MFFLVFLAERQNSLFKCSEIIHTFFGAFFLYKQASLRHGCNAGFMLMNADVFISGNKFYLHFLVRFLPDGNTKQSWPFLVQKQRLFPITTFKRAL